MILLVDIGNSRVKWAMRGAGAWLDSGVLETVALPSWRPAWSSPPEAVVVSCVAGDEAFACLRRVLGLAQVHRVRAQAQGHGLRNEYDAPEQLGADRYAALIAAQHRDLGACVVVSAGTALTVDMLTREGRFLGGCIAPGADLMRASLAIGTAAVAVPEMVAQDWPRNTGAAVAAGITLALCGVVQGVRRRLQNVTGHEVTIVITGGARERLVPWLEPPWVEVDNLVLEGLAWIARDIGYAA